MTDKERGFNDARKRIGWKWGHYWRAHWRLPPAERLRAVLARLRPDRKSPDLRAGG